MRCPACHHPETMVRDSRPCDDGTAIRRRRMCLACQHRWRTYETAGERDTALMSAIDRLTAGDRKLVITLIERLAGRPVAAAGLADAPAVGLEIDFDA